MDKTKRLPIVVIFFMIVFVTTAFAKTALIPPVAVDDAYETIFEESITIDEPGVLENDTGTGLTAELVTDSVEGGVAEVFADGSIEYAPPAGFVGADTFTYRAFDGVSYSNTATVTITVAELPPGPVFTDEAEFLSALTAEGVAPRQEGFEDDAVWGSVRTTIAGGAYTASSVSNLGVSWTSNNDTSQITTGAGPARSGLWGFYSLPHGNYLTGVDCHIPGNCTDGFKGTSTDPFVAIGGWISSGGGAAKINLILDGDFANPIDLGVVYSGHRFLGYIDSAGFHDFEFREMEGTSEDAKYIFADDFTFGFAAVAPTDLSITAQGGDALLTWSDTGADHYEVWHSVNAPYFISGADCSLSPDCAIATTGTFTYQNDIGDPNQNNFFIVRAVNATGIRSGESNVVGEFDFSVNPGAGP